MGTSRGRVALITGAAGAIGAATARALEAAGLLTVATARDPRTLAELAECGCETLSLDVTDDSSARRAVRTIESRFGSVYALVNAAGVPLYGPVEETSLEAARALLEVNLLGVARMCALVLPGMRHAGIGRIVNVGALAVDDARGSGFYRASKQALEALSDALREEVRGFGVDVVTVLPAPVAGSFGERALTSLPNDGVASAYEAFKAGLAGSLRTTYGADNPRLLDPDAVARAIVRAVTASRPDRRCRVGAVSKLTAVLKRVTPERLWGGAIAPRVPGEER